MTAAITDQGSTTADLALPNVVRPKPRFLPTR
jgi:hypothetical protein